MARKIDIKRQRHTVKERPRRPDDKRSIRCRFLIVCEGSKTEPNYFRSFESVSNSGSWVPDVETTGKGTNTIQVVDQAIELRDDAARRGNPYDAVWAVFDRDSFPAVDFDNAIQKADSHGIGCAWSNEAFELWYIYHFLARTTPMSRQNYGQEITKHICRHPGRANYAYKKNDPAMRRILAECGCDEEEAIKRAERQEKTFSGWSYHAHNPCTMVYKLVRQLIGKDPVLVAQVKEKLKER